MCLLATHGAEMISKAISGKVSLTYFWLGSAIKKNENLHNELTKLGLNRTSKESAIEYLKEWL